MGAKLITIASLAFLVACSHLAPKESGDSGGFLIEYAIAYCLSKSYVGTDYSSDARHIAGAYLQKGESGLDKYQSIRNYVDQHIEKDYTSKHGRNLEIMRCIDLVNYKETIESL